MMLELKNISKKFKNEQILENINVKFKKNKIYAIVGRNGSGKSVLLKIICGMYSPTTGEVLFDGEDYIKKYGVPKNTRASIEKPDFISELSGFENLNLLARIQNKITKQEILESLEKVNLIEEKDKLFSKYSQGMKQKLAFAQVIMELPEIMIFDEPFNGMDDESTKKLRSELVNLKKDRIIIIATHYNEDIKDIADEVYKIENKKIWKL